MAFNRSYSHTVRRLATYALLWLTAAALMGVSAYRIHRTRSESKVYERVVAELLAASVLTLLWVPVAMFLLLVQRAVSTTHRQNSVRSSRMHPRLPVEMAGNFLLWLMFLVGIAYYTNQILPGRNFCAARARGTECNILTSILALGWIAWSWLTILGVLGLMHYSSAGRSTTGNIAATEKTRNGANVTSGANNGGNLNAPNQPLV